jgi:hypothetical protein
MKRHITALIAGLVFALGVGISGMTLPERVIGFLDFFGSWDPTLLFVIGGAVGTYLLLFPLVTRRRAPVFARRFGIPTRRDIDARLLGGSALFGLGWGLAGFCPGPALTAVPSATPEIGTFALAMIGGMVLFRAVETWRAGASERESDGPAEMAGALS